MGFIAFEFGAGNADAHTVVEVAALTGFFGQHVGADVDDFAVHGAKDGEVVGIEFDAGILSNGDKSNVAGVDFGFGDEVVAHRQQFHDHIAGTHHAANGVDFDVVDDAVHGGHQFGVFQHLAAVAQLFALGVEVFLRLGHFGLRVLEVFVALVGQLRLDVGHRAL